MTVRCCPAQPKTTIEQYGAALEEATGIQTVAVVVDFLDGARPGGLRHGHHQQHGASASRAKTTAWSCCLRAATAKSRSARAQALDRVMSGAKCGDLIDDNIDYFADNKFDKGMLNLYEDVCTISGPRKGQDALPLAGRFAAAAIQQRLRRQPTAVRVATAVTTKEALICSSSSLGLSLFTSSSACFLTR